MENSGRVELWVQECGLDLIRLESLFFDSNRSEHLFRLNFLKNDHNMQRPYFFFQITGKQN